MPEGKGGERSRLTGPRGLLNPQRLSLGRLVRAQAQRHHHPRQPHPAQGCCAVQWGPPQGRVSRLQAQQHAQATVVHAGQWAPQPRLPRLVFGVHQQWAASQRDGRLGPRRWLQEQLQHRALAVQRGWGGVERLPSCGADPQGQGGGQSQPGPSEHPGPSAHRWPPVGDGSGGRVSGSRRAGGWLDAGECTRTDPQAGTCTGSPSARSKWGTHTAPPLSLQQLLSTPRD